MRLEQHNRLVSAMLDCAVSMLFGTRANSRNQLPRATSAHHTLQLHRRATAKLHKCARMQPITAFYTLIAYLFPISLSGMGDLTPRRWTSPHLSTIRSFRGHLPKTLMGAASHHDLLPGTWFTSERAVDEAGGQAG